jgi:hypothetical protein
VPAILRRCAAAVNAIDETWPTSRSPETKAARVEVEASLDLPGVLECGRWHAIEVVVRQACPRCEKPRYEQLYKRATALANAIYEQLSCPEACPFQELHLRHAEWSCRNGVARARVRKLTGWSGASGRSGRVAATLAGTSTSTSRSPAVRPS